ncbi:MAG: aminoacyl-tRNA hydrolase [Oscillospiraceae bacterium]
MFFKKSGSSFDFAIVGLGNPGAKYENTRHNVGFACVDLLAKKFGGVISKSKCKALYGECRIGDKRVILIKPQTFMNLSGESVVPLLNFYKIDPSKSIIIFDDVLLDVGRLRLRRDGSHGGHNGMRNIIEQSGTDKFMRIKIGVGKKPHPDYDLADWVLSCFKGEDCETIISSVENAADAAIEIVKSGMDTAMNKFNR